MRRRVAAVFLLAAALFACWLWLRDASPPSDPPPAKAVANAAAPDHARDTETPPATPPLAPAEEPTSRTSLPPAAASPTTETSSPRAHVFGRLVGEDDTPITGAKLWLDSVDGAWAKGVEVPLVEIHGYRTHAYQTASDAEGKFEFDVPLPTADWVTFFFEPDDFHAIDGREFGPAGGRNQDRMHAAENDLGTFRLAWTGAVEGSVRASDGTPLDKAEVSIHGALSGARVIHCRSESDGHFLLGHVPEGTWVLKVKHAGFQSVELKSVRVESRRRTKSVEIALEPADSFSGIVVDEQGAPVGNVEIESWPEHGGQGAYAKTATDGTFTMSLPEKGRYRLNVETEGYDHFGGFNSPTYEPGARDVRVVLKRAKEIEVLVVDAESGGAIERYGIGISVVASDIGSTDEQLDVPKIESHPAGRAKIARPSGTVMARLRSPGYASISVPLEQLGSSSQKQTIRMTKAASIAGRVVLAALPHESVRVDLQAAWLKRDVSQPDEPDEERFWSDNYTRDVTGFAGRPRHVEVDAEGRFRFDDLVAGHFQLAIRTSKTAPYVRESIAVASKQALDLGDITLSRGCSIHGRIAATAAHDLGRWYVTLDRPNASERVEVGSNQDFHLDGIDPGKHVLFVNHEDSNEDPKPMLEVELAAGETKDVVIDVALLLPAQVTVHVTRGGRPLENVRVIGYCETTRQETWIGEKTDAQGAVSGRCAPCDAVQFTTLSELQLFLGGDAVVQHVSPGARLEIALSVTPGQAKLEFPTGFSPPSRGQAYITVIQAGGTGARARLVTASTADSPMTGNITWKDRVIDLGDLAPGEYTIQVNVTQLDEGSGPRIESRAIGPGYQGKLVVRPDELAVCVLAPNEERK